MRKSNFLHQRIIFGALVLSVGTLFFSTAPAIAGDKPGIYAPPPPAETIQLLTKALKGGLTTYITVATTDQKQSAVKLSLNKTPKKSTEVSPGIVVNPQAYGFIYLSSGTNSSLKVQMILQSPKVPIVRNSFGQIEMENTLLPAGLTSKEGAINAGTYVLRQPGYYKFWFKQFISDKFRKGEKFSTIQKTFKNSEFLNYLLGQCEVVDKTAPNPEMKSACAISGYWKTVTVIYHVGE